MGRGLLSPVLSKDRMPRSQSWNKEGVLEAHAWLTPVRLLTELARTGHAFAPPILFCGAETAMRFRDIQPLGELRKAEVICDLGYCCWWF